MLVEPQVEPQVDTSPLPLPPGGRRAFAAAPARPAVVASLQPVDHVAGLLATMSIFAHDLRGPLANLAILLEGIETAATKNDAGPLAEQSRRSQSIVQALDDLLTAMLDRTRRTGDPLGVKPAPVDLDLAIEAAIGLSLPLAASRRVRIRRHGGRNIVVMGDHGLLVQALDNLIGNAVKHAPSGTTVSVSVAAPADELEVRVANAGPPLTETDLARAFRPFTRLSTTAEASRASFGLGLWIVRLIAERHGGSVTAAPRTDGSGARFSLHLPRTA